MHPPTRPVDLLAHFLWTSGLSSPPEGPPGLLSTGSSCTWGACRCTSRKESCLLLLPWRLGECAWGHIRRGALDKHSCSAWCQGEPAPSVSRATATNLHFIVFYTTWSCATFLLLWNMWTVRKVVELKINKLNIPIQVWGEARDTALLTHSRWCNVAGPQISLWVARLSRGTCIFKNWSIVDLQ